MKGLAILGSTGSIGKNTLSVIRQHPDLFRAVVLAARKNVQTMFEQCLEFKPRYAVLSDEVAAGELRIQLKLHGSATEVLSGSAAICEVVQLDEVDQVMAAITGGRAAADSRGYPCGQAYSAGEQRSADYQRASVFCRHEHQPR